MRPSCWVTLILGLTLVLIAVIVLKICFDLREHNKENGEKRAST